MSRDLWSRFGRLIRFGAAGTCLLLAIYTALTARGGPASTAAVGGSVRTVRVVVAGRDVPAGHVLRRTDLTTARRSADAVAQGTLTVLAHAVGRTTAVPLAARDPVTDRGMTGPQLATGLPPGTVTTSVTTDDAASTLQPGRRVDVLATPATSALDSSLDPSAVGSANRPPAATDDGPSGGGSSAAPSRVVVVARRVLVLSVGTAQDAITGGAEAVLSVAVPREVAVRLVELRALSVFSVVMDAP